MQKQIPKLEAETFSHIVRHAVLISIDLLLFNEKNEVILGLRRNRPAQGFYFAPGGRIMKGETIRDAFQRISMAELGLAATMQQADFLGVYEHLYPKENYFGEEGYGTHYIVLAFSLHANKVSIHPPRDQHDRFEWFNVADLLNDANVHPNTKDYFNGTLPVR